MSRHEWFRGLPELADIIWIVPSQEHVDQKGFKRIVEVWDQRGTLELLADLAAPQVSLQGREIYRILSDVANGHLFHRCAVCSGGFTVAHLPVCYLFTWPMPPNYWDDYIGIGVCCSCAVRPSFLWTDALAVVDRIEEFFIKIPSAGWDKV